MICSLCRLLRARLCSFLTSLRLNNQHPLTSSVTSRPQASSRRIAVTTVTSERLRLTCRRHRSGSVCPSRTVWNTASRRQGMAKRESARRFGAPLSRDQRTALRGVQHRTGLSCLSSREKLSGSRRTCYINHHITNVYTLMTLDVYLLQR